MSRLERYARALASLVAVGVFAGIVGTVLRYLLTAAGVSTGRASPIAIAVAVALTLAVADVYTPIGRGPRSNAIREKQRAALASDFLLAAALAAVVASGLTLLGAAAWPPLGDGVVVMIAGVAAGYGGFMWRNRRFYLPTHNR